MSLGRAKVKNSIRNRPALAASDSVGAFAVAVAVFVWRAREVKMVMAHGSVRWAQVRELRHAGLLYPDGVLLGGWFGVYLHHHGPKHVRCLAPN